MPVNSEIEFHPVLWGCVRVLQCLQKFYKGILNLGSPKP